MSSPKLRQQIKKAVDRVPTERLQSLAEYIQFLSRPPLVHLVERAEKAITTGQSVPWRSVRDDL